jgi:glycosyltransferase involved in cell wall biosynthesis
MIKTKPRLSVVLATFNEAKNLPRCLDSVANLADEIIVVDGRSADQTVSIAKKYGAKVKLTDNRPNFHINKNLAIDMAKGDWLLQLDADEVVSKPLSERIRKIIRTPGGPDGYWLPRLNYFLGRPLTKGGQYPDYTLRLYRNGAGRLPAKDVHEQAVVKGEVAYLSEDLLHFNTPDFENYLLRHNRYTSLLAGQLGEKHLSLGLASAVNYLFWQPVKEFFSLYFRHRGYVDGFPGFVFAFFSGLRFAVAYIKYWQKILYPAV